jgi:adenine-specific DNA-methyltransferase
MDKLKMHSPDITQQNIDKLLELFPNCKTEKQDDNGELSTGVDFDLLKQELSKNIVEGHQERYQLNWPGKKQALLTANAPIAKTLRPCREESVDFDTTENLFIEGDNLDALKLLQETYLDKVKMIYIDPPYNTGNDFIYNDDFVESADGYLLKTNQTDESGLRLVANSDSKGRYHSDWLSMIYPRIKLAHKLLSDDGAIFISIDDNEVDSLRKVCSEVFGATNFITTAIWQKMFSPKNTAAYFSVDHDYVVVYAKNKALWKPTLLPRSEESKARYKNPDNDPRGPWLSGAIQARNFYSKGQYEMTSPSGKKYSNPKGTYWRFSELRFNELDKDNRIWWGESGSGVPRLKRFLTEVKDGVVPQTLLKFDIVGHTQEAKEEFNKFVSFEETENILNSVKPTRLIKHLLKIGTNTNSKDILLDFFVGSGPSLQALLEQNEADGGDRKFIGIQIAEPLPVPESQVKTIADLAKSRLKNSTKNLSTDKDIGFRVLKIDSSNMNDVHYTPDDMSKDDLFNQVEHIKTDRDSEDLLFQVMLDWSVDLSLPIRKETIEGKEVYFVNDDDLVACFDKGIDEALIKALAVKAPLRVVFRDDSFISDSVKINVEQIFKQLAPATDIKAI